MMRGGEVDFRIRRRLVESEEAVGVGHWWKLRMRDGFERREARLKIGGD